jgi:LPS-assembly protein
MSKRCKVTSKNISALLVTVIVFLITLESNGKYLPYHFIEKATKNYHDTPVNRNRADTSFRRVTDTSSTRNVSDTITAKRDSLVQTIDTFNVKMSQDSLDAPISYAAADSGVLLIPEKQFILYGKSNTKYTDIEVDAAVIRIDQEKNMVTAYGAKDTLGNPLDKPKLKQGEMVTNSDSIFYNLKSQKGLTKSSYLQEGEMFVYANTVKKVDENTLYAWRGRFTTCNLDTPHFAFRTRKMKIINKKLAVSGPASPEFEGVPVPIGIPFGIYPLNRGRHSGLLPPQFAANEDFGLGLEGLGYYKVLNEYVDVTVRSNLYSYGGWSLNVAPTYMKRYRFNGGLNLAIQNTKILNRTGYQEEEFTTNKSFMINWHHAVNPKARPGTSFSANVNAGSTKYNQYVPNNANLNFQNQLSSSISYSKDWRGKFNLSVNANHSQNNATRLINLSLPNITFNAVTLYPFQRKEQVGTQKWYEKLGIAYTGSLQNQVSFYDSAFNLRRILDTTQWYVNHNIPISLSLPQLGPIQLSPSVSYSERWFGQAQSAYYDTTLKVVRTQATRGFYTERETQFSFAANTRIFGTYNFKKSSSVTAIRHEIRPQVSFNYKPDLNKGNFSMVRADSTNRIFLPFSTITGQQVLGDRRFAGMSFGVDNLLEMKARNKKDTSEGGVKKIRLIDGFGFSSAYNFLADSMKLSPFSLYARSTLFEKINISASATLDPYQLNKDGIPINKYAWSDGRFSPGRISNGQIAISTSFASKSKDGKTQEERLPQDDYMTPDEQQRQLDYVRDNPSEFTDFNIPWNVSLSYSLSYSKSFNPYAGGFQTSVFSNVSVNGDFSLTPRWKVGGSTYFDFTTAKIQTLNMFISREMHCWQMSINLAPIGLYRSFSITINPKSGILRDLKINRSRYFYNQ